MTNSSSDVMIWVKEAEVESAVFTVFVSPDAIVDHLKDAIKNKMEYTYGAPLLTIKVKVGGDYVEQEVDAVVSEITSGEYDNLIYFTQPATYGK